MFSQVTSVNYLGIERVMSESYWLGSVSSLDKQGKGQGPDYPH